jgi:hypothetical protein
MTTISEGTGRVDETCCLLPAFLAPNKPKAPNFFSNFYVKDNTLNALFCIIFARTSILKAKKGKGD